MKFLISYLQRADRSSLTSGLGYHRLLLAATDCVWCTVVGNPVVEDIFLEEGGVFCLLDLLQVSNHKTTQTVCVYMCVLYMQVCPDSNQNLVLGVLVDLCENPKVAISCVIAPSLSVLALQLPTAILLCVSLTVQLHSYTAFLCPHIYRQFLMWWPGEGERQMFPPGLCWPLSGDRKKQRWEYLAETRGHSLGLIATL